MANWVSKGGLAGAKRHDSKHDLGIGINPIIGQTKSTCYMNLTGTDKKPLNAGKKAVTQHKLRSKTKKADRYHKHITNDWTLNFCDKANAELVRDYADNHSRRSRRTRKRSENKSQICNPQARY